MNICVFQLNRRSCGDFAFSDKLCRFVCGMGLLLYEKLVMRRLAFINFKCLFHSQRLDFVEILSNLKALRGFPSHVMKTVYFATVDQQDLPTQRTADFFMWS